MTHPNRKCQPNLAKTKTSTNRKDEKLRKLIRGECDLQGWIHRSTIDEWLLKLTTGEDIRDLRTWLEILLKRFGAEIVGRDFQTPANGKSRGAQGNVFISLDGPSYTASISRDWN